MNKLSGIIAAPFTPFTEQDEIDFQQIETIADLLIKNQVNAAFICGTTGEAPSLSHQEKIQIFEKWGSLQHDQLQIIGMLGGTCLREIKELAKTAADNKLEAISILAPYYFKPNLDTLVNFCADVASAVPDLPFYYYHIPSLTGAFFSMRSFLEKAEMKIPNLAGIKFTHSDLMDFNSCKMYKDGKYTMLWGTDEALLSSLVVGADGAVGSTYNYAAPLYHEIIKNYNLGNMPEAAALQGLSVKMVEILIKYGGSSAGKAFMKIIGVDCGANRLPLYTLTDQQLSQLRNELEAINFFEFCSKT